MSGVGMWAPASRSPKSLCCLQTRRSAVGRRTRGFAVGAAGPRGASVPAAHLRFCMFPPVCCVPCSATVLHRWADSCPSATNTFYYLRWRLSLKCFASWHQLHSFSFSFLFFLNAAVVQEFRTKPEPTADKGRTRANLSPTAVQNRRSSSSWLVVTHSGIIRSCDVALARVNQLV